MAQISVVGTGGDYTTLADWESGESSSDYGAGNPAIAEITGSVAKENITGTWPQGFIIRAKAGEEAITGAGTAIITGAVTILIPSTVGAQHEVNDLILAGLDVRTSDATTVTTCNRNIFSDIVDANNANCTLRVNNCYSVNVTRGYGSDIGADTLATNCTVIGVASGNYGFVRWKTTNCFVFADAGTGYLISTAGSDYNASDDTSSPGANSLDNRTTADFADYAGGDYRTASGSALATAGEGGTFIGYELEAAGGTNVLATTDALVLTEQAAVVNAAISVAATTDTLLITEQSASISLGVGVNATTAALVLAEQAATVTLVDVGDDTNVLATKQSLLITEQAATVNAALNVGANTDSLLITGLTAQVGAGLNVVATTQALTITEQSAGVRLDRNVLATTTPLVITEQSAVITATIAADVLIDGAGTSVISVDYKSTTLYFNGEHYFTVS